MYHAQMDGMSIPIMSRDMVRFYTDVGTMSHRPINHGDYVSYLARLDKQKAITFWKSHLASSKPCMFPKLAMTLLDTEPTSRVKSIRCMSTFQARILRYYEFCKTENQVNSVQVGLGSGSSIKGFCRNHGVSMTSSSLLHVVWALVLRQYAGTDSTVLG